MIKFPQIYLDNESETGAGAAELTVDEIDTLLAQEDDKEESSESLDKVEDEDKLEAGKESEETELSDIKLKDEEPEEEIEQLVVPVSKAKILAKYPNLFKDFPYLERAYYADQHYKEIFPTLDDAKEAQVRSDALGQFESQILGGDIGGLLSIVKNESPEAFYKIADNLLPTIAAVDQRAFHHIIGLISKQTIMTMVQEAKASNNEQLQAAALILNQFVFGKSTFEPPMRLSKPEENDGKVEKERQEFAKERFETAKEELDTKVFNTLKSTINDHIDPKGSMTEYVKKNAVREALELVDKLVSADKVFGKTLDSLWKRAFETNFNRDSIQRIRSAYLAKAKTILPAVIKKTRNEALQGLSRTSGEPKKRTLVSPDRTTRTSTTKEDANKIPRGMKTLDFLMKD